MPRNKKADKAFSQVFTNALISNGGNIGKAYQTAKPSVTIATARTEGSKYLKTHDITEDIQFILNRNGVTNDAVAKALKGMLSATKLQDTSEGVKTVDDNTNINTAIVTALKAKGVLREGQGQVNIQIGTSIQSADELARIERLMADAKMILGKLGYLDKQTAQEADVSRETNGQDVAPQDVT